MFEGSACAGHGGFCHLLLSPRDLYQSPCKRARHWAPPPLTDSEPGGLRKQPRPRRCSPIDRLPDECLSEILGRLDERAAASCVSKRWLSVLSACRSNQGVQWDGARCFGGKEATDLRMAAVTARANGGLRHLLVLGQPGDAAWKLTDAGLTVVARGSPSLAALSLSHAPLVTDLALCEVSTACTNLEKLHLSRCPMLTDDALVAIANNCPNLSSLSIHRCPHLGDRGGLQAVGRCCRNLQSVSVVGCTSVGDQAIATLVCSASSTLTRLKLHNLNNITDVCLAVIGLYGKALTDLSLVGLRAVNERGFWIMGNARGLRTLNTALINGCPGATDVAVQALATGSPALRRLCLRRCCAVTSVAATANMLEHLHLEECSGISAAAVLAAAGAGLKALSLVKCTGITDAHVVRTNSSSLSHLRSLTVRDCPAFGDACLTTIRNLCPCLSHVHLTGRLAVTHAGILTLLHRTHAAAGLVKLHLAAQMVTHTAVSALANAHGATLKLLNLHGCTNLSDDDLLDIAAACYLLEDLDVSTSSVTDVGVAAALPQLHLRVLSLSGCSAISDRCLPFIKCYGNSLTALNLLNCNQISQPAARLLRQEMGWCDIIF